MKLFFHLTVALAFLVTADRTFAAKPTQLATQLPAKKKKKPAKVSAAIAKAPLEAKSLPKKTVAIPPGRITQLPPFKAKRRTYSPPISGVVVRAMSAEEYQTYAANAEAEAKATALVQTKLVAAPLPIETMQIDDLESQVIDEISDAPHPLVAEAPVPLTTVTTLPPLAPSVVAIPDSDEAIRQEMAAQQASPPPAVKASLSAPVEEAAATEPTHESTHESTSAPLATPIASPPASLPEAPAVVIPAEAPEVIPVPEGDLARTETLPHDLKLRPARIHHLRVHVAYLAARYGNVQNDLENGSTTLGLSYSRDFDFVEGRIGVDLTHGLDQKVELADSRMVLLRLDASHTFLKRGFLSPFVSSGLGYAVSNVRSYRSQSDGSTVVRDHLESRTFAFIPGAGARLNLSPQFDLDLALEYLGLFGGPNAASLGGLSAGAYFGFTF